jgi:hypothetical protein
MRTIALAAAVSALLASAAVAQPDINADPNYGSVNLESGFTPDPYEHAILAGGAAPAAQAKTGCEGKVSAAPDLHLFFEAGDMDLTFLVEGSEDTTLLINTPNGRWYCDDDSGGGFDPRIQITNPQSGRYDIWVGAYGDEMVQSTLKISELD